MRRERGPSIAREDHPMNQQEFHEFAAAACRRAVAQPGSIG
jgi:hypothetical protein